MPGFFPLLSTPSPGRHLQLINKASNVGRWVKKHRSTHGIFDELDEQIVKKLAAHVSTLLAKRNLQRQNQACCAVVAVNGGGGVGGLGSEIRLQS